MNPLLQKNAAMKIDELMINDWIMLKSNEKIGQVESINAYPTHHSVFISGDENVYLEEDFKGIPLTEDILKKNFSYDKNDELYYYNGLNFIFSEEDNAVLVGQNGIGFYGDEFHYFTFIKTVHELQHVLKICKIYIEIEL